MMRIFATVFAALLGLAFGSFLNVCLSRWPEGESIVHPRSHCRACGRTLSWWENVPLASWLLLRGRCHDCGESIGIRYPLVEAAIGALWALAVWKAFPSLPTTILPEPLVMQHALQGLGQMALLWLLVALAALDAENLWLPDFLTVSGIVLGLVLGLGYEAFGTRVNLIPHLLRALSVAIVGILIAAGLILIIRWIYWLLRRQEGIGLGDAKLMAMLAAWLGLSGAMLSLFLGVVLGAAVALVLLATQRSQADRPEWTSTKLPLGTFLCLGGIVSSLWGEKILALYYRWAGV